MGYKNPEKQREYSREYYAINSERIKKLNGDRKRKYLKLHPEKSRESSRKYRASHPGKQASLDRKKKYGVTEEDFSVMISAQQGKCKICGVAMKMHGRTSGDRCCVDHDHTTNKVRGLLCHKCNGLLGKCNDNPRVLMCAIDYLNGVE